MTRHDIDLLDRHCSARKFTKQKEKALLREWRKDKNELKARTL